MSYEGISAIDGNPQLIDKTLTALVEARRWLIAQGFPVPPVHVVMGQPGAGGSAFYFLGLDSDGSWRLFIPANDLFNAPVVDSVLYFDLIHEYGHCFAAQLMGSGRATAAELYGAGNAEHFADNFALMLGYPPASGMSHLWLDTPALPRASLLLLWARPAHVPLVSPEGSGALPPLPSVASPTGAGAVFVEAGLFSLTRPAGGEFGAPRPNGPHTGQDFSTPIGTPLPALFAGVVTDYEQDTLGGIEARLRRPNGDLVLFAHCRGVVDTGAVAEGSLIAYSGNTGSATTGPHVHLEVRVNGVAVEPLAYCAKEGAMGMTEDQLRALVRNEVEKQYDLTNTVAAIKSAIANVVKAIRAFGQAV